MGYAVYEDTNSDRWAGYGVPAKCDWPDCEQHIDRGLGYKCETHTWVDDGGDDIVAGEDGCGLFFCLVHRYEPEQHAGIEPKPDVAQWISHMLTDESWQSWREENPARVAEMREQVDVTIP